MPREDLPPCETLARVIETQVVDLPDGTQKRLVAGISPRHARALYDTVLREKPSTVVEIGMAQGLSTLSILCALKETGGRLISIDPYEGWPSARKAALHNVERAGYAEHHEHVPERSCDALPRLLAQGLAVDLGYVDGCHDFDHAFIDFFYLDQMLTIGGLLAFNDAGWPTVHRVIQYLRKHGTYAEEDIGLRRNFTGRNPLVTVARHILRRPRQDRYFRKLESSAPT